MKCARCNRPLRFATIQINGCNYGPKCSERMGLSTTKTRRQAKAARATQRELIRRDMWPAAVPVPTEENRR